MRVHKGGEASRLSCGLPGPATRCCGGDGIFVRAKIRRSGGDGSRNDPRRRRTDPFICSSGALEEGTGRGGGEGGWELITCEAFCPAAAAKMQMEEASRLAGKKAMDGLVWPWVGWDGCTQLGPLYPWAPLHPGGAVRLPGPGLRWIDW